MINICIHGHFYQPPRENPWTNEIEQQESASPFHNWNERIWDECYKPNSEAEILNDKGSVVAKVNNYEMINFNFGPALLSWLKRKHPETYSLIIEADKKSIIEHNGHGNAIAMCYNHMIMPLANFNDKVTQIRWGVEDFIYHFGRLPEGIWLPETACDQETIEVLIKEKISYIILDTSQAEEVREIGSEDWIKVVDGKINPKNTYRCYSRQGNGYLNIIFYDGQISRAVAFDDVLLSSQNLLMKIFTALNPVSQKPQLISVATDGETFGHHKKHAERTLAYFMKVLAPENGLKTVNFGEYISQNPPQYEVKIKQGEGTSWSCPHGVERWKDDCGCGHAGKWKQSWRKPLRASLNWLRDELIKIYSSYGNSLFKDIWDARNDYIKIILDDSSSVKKEFFRKHSSGRLSKKEKELCLRLLEMQKYSMLMFTSCGWFFSEISGLETVQILQYASRAMELASDISGVDLENRFVEMLSHAPSNMPEFKNGKGVWEKLVKPVKRTI
ncbi:MAG: DUF3536 domain-containing protein [Ignavibacteria bacterium]|nr:DUF3536 domain-containing protein [Ignavibacteria bacterium]